jgi:hypothetical protein
VTMEPVRKRFAIFVPERPLAAMESVRKGFPAFVPEGRLATMESVRKRFAVFVPEGRLATMSLCENGSRSSSRRDAVNLAQDFSPGTASGLSDLVPEARLSPCSNSQFARLSCSHRLYAPCEPVTWSPGAVTRTSLSLECAFPEYASTWIHPLMSDT